MDKIAVRLVIVISTIYMAFSFGMAWNGIDLSYYDSLFFPSTLMGTLLTILCHSQGKFHCVYMRGLCYNQVATPTIIFLDYHYNLFEDASDLLFLLSALWAVSVSSTFVLAVDHFRKVKKLNRKRNGIHQVN